MYTNKSHVEEAFLRVMKQYGMNELAASRRNVVIAYSGGADSSCLLFLMKKYADGNGLNLAAVHVNHLIRGDDAYRDADFCRANAEKLGVPFYLREVNVPKYAAEHGMGLEAAARDVRYSFFAEINEKLGGAVTATAHTMSDNAETVIFNMLRGCGTHGMTGISAVREGTNGELFIRPLIECGGEEIRQFCHENGIEYVTDSTNTDTAYTRNYIRHTIMPALKRLNPEPERALTRTAYLAGRDDDYLEKTARGILDGRETMPREELNGFHPALASRIIIAMCESSGAAEAPSEKQIGEIIRLSKEKNGECGVSLSGGMRACIGRGEVSIVRETRDKRKNAGIPDADVFLYPQDGDVFENEYYIIEFSHGAHKHHITSLNTEENIYKLSILNTFRFDKIKGVLKIRYRLPGDALVFGGMTHKVKKLFGDKKLPADERAKTPIVCDEGGILLIPGFPPRDGSIKQTDSEDCDAVTVYKKAEYKK